MKTFPWKYAGLNTLLVLMAFAVDRINRSVIPVVDSVSEGIDAFFFLLLFTLPGVFVVVLGSLIYQGLLYKLLHRIVKWKTAWLSLFLLPSIAVCSHMIYASSSTVQVQRVLKAGRLARLPADATDVRVYLWSGIFTGAKYLRFRASSQSIDRFINNSPSLSKVEPERFSKQNMHVPYPDDFESPRSPQTAHDYFHRDTIAPSWFSEELRNSGRLYEIPPVNGHNWGIVVVRDNENIVFIRVTWS